MVLLSYMMVRHAMTVDELQVATGLSDDAIRPALKSLAAKGLLFKQVGEHGRANWLPRADTFFGRTFQNPEKPDSGVLNSSSSIRLMHSLPLEQEQEEELQNPEKPDSARCRSDVYAALDAAGIREPKRSELARMKHVDAEFVAGHVAKGAAEGVELGTVIYRIKNDWPLTDRFARRTSRLDAKIELLRKRG